MSVVPGFELFGDAAPGGEAASCSGGWTERRPEIVGGVGRGRDDAVGSGVVEGVVEVGDGVGESGAFGGGCVVVRFPRP